MNENKFYHGGYVDTDIASTKATANAIYGEPKNEKLAQYQLKEKIEMLEVLRNNITNDNGDPRHEPMLTVIKDVYPSSTRFVLGEVIEMLKAEVKPQPQTEWRELPYEEDDYIM